METSTSTSIKSEIDKTDSRIAELEMELERQTASVQATEKAFIDGTADAAKLNDAQGKLSLYERTIESLRATYQKLKSAFETQSAQERRAELLKQMAAAANEVEAGVNQYLETRSEFHTVVSDYAEKLVKRASAYQKKQAEYQSIVSELKPTAAEIQESGLDQKTRTMAAATYFNHEPLEYGEVISRAENQLAAKLNRAAQAKRTAAYHAGKTENATV
jgi:uncharacterized phage infection (PIP) family protein YhgE